MVKLFIVPVFLLTFVVLSVLGTAAAADPGGPPPGISTLASDESQSAPAEITPPDGVVFIGKHEVDVAASCSYSTYNMTLTILRDGNVIASATAKPRVRLFFRDSGLEAGATHVYTQCCKSNAGRTPQPPTCNPVGTAVVGRVGGELYQSLSWTGETVELYRDVDVWEGATLDINSATVVKHPSVSDRVYIASDGHEGGDYPPGGDIRLQNATITNVTVEFASAGTNFVNNSHFSGSSGVTAGEVAELTITGPGTFEGGGLLMTGSSHVTIDGVDFLGAQLDIMWGAPDVTITGSRFLEIAGISIHQNSGTATYRGNTFRRKAPGSLTTAIYVEKDPYGDTTGSATIADNVISGYVNGIILWQQAAAVMTGNSIVNNAVGIDLGPGGPAQVSANCIASNTQLGVNAQRLKATQELKDNWWGSASGPQHTTNPTGAGNRIAGDRVNFRPYLEASNCRTEPPPLDVSTVTVSADPDGVIPNGTATTWITAEARDAKGAPVSGAEVAFAANPGIGRFGASTCTTAADGRCRIQYVAPTPEAAQPYDEVAIIGSAGGQSARVTVTLLYLQVLLYYPPQVTNVELVGLAVKATFNSPVDPTTRQAFKLSSSRYFENIPCQFDDDPLNPETVVCRPGAYEPYPWEPTALGLQIRVHVKGGPTGLRGEDGRFLKTDGWWEFWTTPYLWAGLAFDQVREGGIEGGTGIAGKPAALRVGANLNSRSELPWVDANVTITYTAPYLPGAVVHTHARQRFYREDAESLEAILKGNSANFTTATGELPIQQPGTLKIGAVLEPADQMLPAGAQPRRYRNDNGRVTLAALKEEAAPFPISMYPIAPWPYLFDDFPYNWSAGQVLSTVSRQPIVTQGPHYLEKWTPLADVRNAAGNRVEALPGPLFPHPKQEGAWYVARLVRLADAAFAFARYPVVLLVPWDWWATAYGGGRPTTATYHGPARHVCLTALDAPARYNPEAVVAWCVAHLQGLPDVTSADTVQLLSYDVERDRFVDSRRMTGYWAPVMGFDRFGAGLSNLWMDSATYGALVTRYVQGGATAGEPAGAAVSPYAETLTVGGEIVRAAAAVESGMLDVAELPARGDFPAPGGTGEYRLRLLGAGGALLAEHAFTPEFTTLREGLDYASFTFNVPAPAGLHSVALVRGATNLATLAASANAPSVAIQAPAGGSYSGALEARWTGRDADAGPSLTYTVLLSPDNGANWQTVSPVTTAIQLTVDTTQYSTCTQCRLKVIASDGFYAASALSATFAISNPPRVTATWPPDGAPDAPIWPAVTASFRDAMDAASINGSTFALVDAEGQPIAGTVTYQAGSSTATLQPGARLQYGQQYTARLAGTMQAVGGETLGADVVWRFTVERSPFTYTRLPLVVRTP